MLKLTYGHYLNFQTISIQCTNCTLTKNRHLFIIRISEMQKVNIVYSVVYGCNFHYKINYNDWVISLHERAIYLFE